jgi:phage terminase large subunit-like protein
MEWTTACIDWPDRLRARKSIIPPPIFKDEADRALAVFKELRIVDAPGSPTFGESCDQWVFDLVASIFGAYDPDSGRRLITEWFVLVPKKNSKSTIAAGIMMTALVLNWRQSAEFSILAPTVEIANNSFAPARDMCAERTDEDLSALMHAQSHVKTITHRESGAALKVLAADSNTVGGKKGVGTLIDELWLFGKVSNAENMLREATGGLASRPEGFTIFLSTQSDEPPAGVFLQKLKYARDVRDGKVSDPRFVPVIYEYPQEMIESKAYLDPKTWGMVNPNLDYSVDSEFLLREFTKAQNDGAESMVGFLAKHLNVEIGMNLRTDRWSGADFWQRQGNKELTLDYILNHSDVVTVGVDGGGNDDMLGLAVLGRDADSGDWMLWTHAWVRPIALERRKENAPRYRDFERDGDLTITTGTTKDEDARAVADVIERIVNTGLLARIGSDSYGVSAVYNELVKERGVDPELFSGIPQGYKLMGSIKDTERKLADGAFWHAGSRLMSWCVGNARITQSGNSIMIHKAVSGLGKIDPLMAAFCAVFPMAMNPKAVGRSFWETAAA